MGKKTEKKSATISSSERMKKGPVDDGEIHNMKPRDVSKNALEWEKSNLIIKATSKIFTKTTFPNLGLHPYLAELLQSPSDSIKKGFGLPSCTTIQAKSVPLNLNSQRNNVLMKSQTGSGKTLAYLIPVINDLMQLSPTVKREDGTRALIIAPTRELCNQISDVVGKLTQCCVNLVSGCISGGEKKKSEKARLRKGVVVLVSTPGRLLDHIKLTESFDLTNLRWIVMDEVDRLLDMGFEQTILEILSRIKGERLPGLKENHVIPSTDGSNGGSGGSGGGGKHNLVGKWSQQNLVLSKKVSHPEELRYLVASATLSKAVKQLVWPIMRSFNPSIGFAVVDGDQGSISTIRAENDLYEMRPDQQHAGGVVVFNDDNEEGNKDGENEGKELTNALLDEDEKVDAPTRLAQYSMIIPCKWRLTALLSFLYLRRHQKVIVFFSTCDEVDYHALLFHQLKWPTAFNSQTFTPQQSSGGKDDEKNKGFTFTSFDEVNWQEHMKTVSEFDSSEPTQPQGGGGRRKPTSASSSSVSANNATIDPLNWKFTGVFGKDCPMFRLHGKVPQSIRKLVYKEFAKASKGILFCTDVAARGLDLPKVDYILQYDPPCETSDYIHRIGRTARCGLAGSALLFLLPSEQIYLNLLSSHGLLLSSLSLQSMFSEISKEIPNFNEKKWKNYEEIASVILQKNIEDCIYSNKYLIQASIQAYHSYLRAYTTHSKDSKSIFRLNVLHLGHVAKSFGLKETPKEFKQQHQSSIIHDVIGKIFNGEFASKQFKQSLLPAKKKETTTNKIATKNNDDEEDEESEEEGGDDEDNDNEENDYNNEEMELDDDREEEEEGEVEQTNDNAFSDEEDDEEDEDEEQQPVKARKDKNKNTSGISSNDDVVYALGKRKLSFGSNQSAANKKKRLMVASGKFRSAGSYFRKKLRKQSITEFSAN